MPPISNCTPVFDPESHMVRFSTIRPLHNFCSLMCVVWETRSSESYHYQGRYRQLDQHAFFQYTISGAGVFCENGNEHIMTPGKGFLCNAADVDTEYMFRQKHADHWEFMWIAFIGESALMLVEELVKRYGYIHTLSPQSPVLTVFEEYKGMCGLNLELEASVSSRVVCEFLLGLEETARTADTDESSLLLVKKAVRLVRDNLTVDINVGDLSRQLGVSREHLSRIFKEQTGVSPYRYIVRQKMLRACRLLKETDLSNKEISLKLGYGTVENFSRLFKRYSSMTPGRYRKLGFLPVEEQ